MSSANVSRVRLSIPKILAAGLGLALVVVGTTAPLRGAAFGEPTVLRPQRLVPISVAPDAMPPEWPSAALWPIAPFDGSILGEPGPRTDPAWHRSDSVAAAEGELHRHVRVPQSLPDSIDLEPSTSVFSASSYSYQLDLPKIHAALSAAGMDDVQLPTSLHGATIVLNVPAGSELRWGGRRLGLDLLQLRLPTVTVPGEVDLASLRDLMLNDPRIVAADPDVVVQLRAIDDWKNALPVPVNGDAVVSARVDDSEGFLVTDQRTGKRTLVWRRGGDLQMLSGRFDQESLIQVAQSLR